MIHDLQSPNELARSFIFECLTARLKTADMQTAAELAERSGINWDTFLRIADEELVSPILYDALQGRQIVPPPIEEALARKYDYIARRNLFLLHELGQVLAALHTSGMEVIVLKGAALAETVYKNIAFRPMRDLDLLLQRDQRPAARQLLASLGYEQTDLIGRDINDVALQKPGIEPVILELHWSLFHSLHYQQHLSMDWFWQTSRTVQSTSYPIPMLGLEAQILHLCGHLALHHTAEPQLLWHNDLAELIVGKKKEIHWDLLIDKAQTFQLILPLRQILPPLARDWGAPIPEQILQNLQNLPVSPAETRAFALSTAVKRSEGQGYWLKLNEITSSSERIIFVLKWLFPAPATMRSRYRIAHPLLLPLAYPYHLVQGARLAIEAFLTRLRSPDPTE